VSNFLTISGAILFAIVASLLFTFPLFAILIVVGYFGIKEYSEKNI
jgi:uncharacterized membrane protein